MGVKVYVSGISGNKEVKKRQQRVFMILDSKNIPYSVVDITEPGKESDKDFMQTKSTSSGATVGDANPRHPLPPQIFNDEDYCGDYDQFDLANEIDALEQFLKVEVPEQNNISEIIPTKAKDVENAVAKDVDAIIERIETNGIASSREASVESEKKSNGAEKPNDAVEVEESADGEYQNDSQDTSDIKKDANASEDFIQNEQATADE